MFLVTYNCLRIDTFVSDRVAPPTVALSLSLPIGRQNTGGTKTRQPPPPVKEMYAYFAPGTRCRLGKHNDSTVLNVWPRSIRTGVERNVRTNYCHTRDLETHSVVTLLVHQPITCPCLP